MEIEKLNGHWNFMGAALWKTPGFETNDLGYMRITDQILYVLWAGYNQFDPKWIYKSYNLNSDFYSINNFGGNRIGGGYEWNANLDLKNFWNIWTGGSLNTSSLSTDMLRGGPMMKLPGSANTRIGFSTDSRKKLMFSVYANGSLGYENSSNSLYSELDITYKPTNYLVFTISPAYTISYSELQYVTQTNFNGTDRYIFGSIDQKTISTSFRVNLNISPNLTFQYWGQPFVATGKYYNYKFISDPMANRYTDRFITYNNNQLTLDTDHFNIDENLDGKTDYTIDNTDFNVKQFLSNLVVRWEYSPGSTLFLVWSQTRSYNSNSGQLDFFNNLGDLFNKGINTPHNVFLVKFSYRFGLK